MFDRRQSRIIIILGLLGVFACVISLPFLTEYSAIDFKFPVEKSEVIRSADSFIKSQGFLSLPLAKKAAVISNQKGTIYIQKKIGASGAQEVLDSLPLYCWQVDYTFSEGRKFEISSRNQARVLISPLNAQVVGFSYSLPPEQYEYLNILSKKQSEEIAQDFLKSIDFDISDFKLGRYSAIQRKYVFEWEKDVKHLNNVKQKVNLNILGDKAAFFNYFLEIPNAELGMFRVNDIVNGCLFTSLNLLVFVFGLFVLVVAIARRKVVEWRFGIIFAILMALASLINFSKLEYRRDLFLVLFLFVSLGICAVDFIWTWIVSAVAKLFARQAGLNLFPVKISSAIFASYIFFLSGMGFTLFFFVFIIKSLHPVPTLGFDSFFSEFPDARISCLIAPFLSLGAAVFEEVFFRALMVSFLKKHLRNTSWAIIISSLIWCFMHVSPFGNSDIYPGFVKGLILLPIGLLFGYIFVRFGLVCAIATHYLHDLVVVGSAYLEFNNFRYINEHVSTMLIAAIIPLIIAVYFSFWERRCAT